MYLSKPVSSPSFPLHNSKIHTGENRYEQESLELRVCEDCNARHSMKPHDHEHEDMRISNPSSFRDMSGTYSMNGKAKILTPGQSSIDLESRKVTENYNSNSATRPEKNLFSEKPEYSFEHRIAQERSLYHHSRAENTFGFPSQSGFKKALYEASSSKEDSQPDNYEEYQRRSEPYLRAYDEKGQLQQYTKEFESTLDKISSNIDSTLKEDFDRITNKILSKHLGKNTLNKENSSHKNNIEEFADTKHLSSGKKHLSYISDTYPKESEYKIGHSQSKSDLKNHSFLKKPEGVFEDNYENFIDESEYAKKPPSIIGSTDRKKIKAFRDIKRHREEGSSGLYLLPKSPSKTQEEIFKEEGEKYLNNTAQVTNIHKLNEKLKRKTRAMEKKNRFLLSPPKNENNEDLTMDPEEREDKPQDSSDKDENDQQGQEDEFYNLPVDVQVKELENAAIGLIKENRLEEALEALLRCEDIIRKGLHYADPQQMYISNQALIQQIYIVSHW